MLECSEPGRTVFLSQHDNPKRKYPYTWQLIQMPTSLVGINTLVPNQLVAKSIEAEIIKDLKDYDAVQREVTVGNRSRIDLKLSRDGRRNCFIEIKNCTLVENSMARFPDAVTQRGRRHLDRFIELTALGQRCVMFYLIQRMDADAFQPADDIDPTYGRTLRDAVKAGVEVLAYDVTIDLEQISLRKELDVRL